MVLGGLGGVFGGLIGQVFYENISHLLLFIGWIIAGGLIGGVGRRLRPFASRHDEAGYAYAAAKGRQRRHRRRSRRIGRRPALRDVVRRLRVLAAQRTGSGLVILGLCIGLLIGLAQVFLKEAWLKVESGFPRRPRGDAVQGRDDHRPGRIVRHRPVRRQQRGANARPHPAHRTTSMFWPTPRRRAARSSTASRSRSRRRCATATRSASAIASSASENGRRESNLSGGGGVDSPNRRIDHAASDTLSELHDADAGRRQLRRQTVPLSVVSRSRSPFPRPPRSPWRSPAARRLAPLGRPPPAACRKPASTCRRVPSAGAKPCPPLPRRQPTAPPAAVRSCPAPFPAWTAAICIQPEGAAGETEGPAPNICPNPACGVANPARRTQLPALQYAAAHRPRHDDPRPL